MLRVSKAIREEYRAVLFSKGIFAMSHPFHSHEIQRRDVPFIDDISNVKISLNLQPLFLKYAVDPQSVLALSEKGYLSTVKVAPLSYLNGVSIKRNTCIIDIFGCRPATLLLLPSSSVMDTLSQLKGFMTVQLAFFGSVDNWPNREELRYLGQVSDSCAGFDTLVLRISSALEPTLGPFTVTERIRASDEPKRWRKYVTFHPQGYLAGETDRLEAGSTARVEEVP